MSKVFYYKTEIGKNYSNNIPSIRIGDKYATFDGEDVNIKTMKKVGTSTMAPIVGSENVQDGIDQMRELNIPNIYVLINRDYDVFAITGHYQ